MYTDVPRYRISFAHPTTSKDRIEPRYDDNLVNSISEWNAIEVHFLPNMNIQLPNYCNKFVRALLINIEFYSERIRYAQYGSMYNRGRNNWS